MAKVLIVYATDWGSTKKMAEAVAAGVATVEGAEAAVKTAEEATADDVVAADALVLGSPVHMGSMDWRVKQFIDKVCGGLWMGDKIVGKAGAVFVSGGGFGNAGGGCELTMLSMMNNLAELGLLLVPLPKNTPGYPKGGLHWGPYGRSMTEDLQPFEGGVPDERLEAARHHGANVARVAAATKGRALFAE
ncbi:MAG: flavodoxin domain-containing protein [Thermodesulfobacteriota bacterium]|nr:flavodoxin domain-containing protein [Thermodesulfobacteriota bacterium]